MTQNIENKEIRGITVKNAYKIIAQTVVICSFVAYSYYGIIGKLEKFNSHAQLQDLQIETLRTQLKKMQTEIDINSVHIQSLIIDNERIKAKLGFPD